MQITVATWNINSVRLREGLVCRLLREESPDILCLQELKSRAEFVVTSAFEELGYVHSAIRGQKGYNGVAINWTSLMPCGRGQARKSRGGRFWSAI